MSAGFTSRFRPRSATRIPAQMLADTEAIIRAAGQERSALYIVNSPAASHVQTWRDGATLDYCELNATLNQRR
jgi:hypothetical protein